jgi:hypothetical protein
MKVFRRQESKTVNRYFTSAYMDVGDQFYFTYMDELPDGFCTRNTHPDLDYNFNSGVCN